MMFFLLLLYIPLGVVCLITLFNALTAPMVAKGPLPARTPLVSVLVPARDEENNIRTCLASLCAQDYPDLEILVLDDHSHDKTAELVNAVAQVDRRVRLLSGQAMPAGWTGKNWACHQLSQAARGDLFVFTDADNFYATSAVTRTVGWIEKLDLALFSAFPQQITITLAEKLIVPVFDLFVQTMLPLRLTYLSRHASLSAANGQWLAFTRPGYRAVGGHEAVKHRIVEDTALSRRAKKLGLKTLTASGRDAVKGRMYHSWREVWLGFSKNAFGLMEFKTIPFFGFLFFLFFIFVLPFILLLHPLFFAFLWPAVVVNLLIRAVLAVKYAHPFLAGVLLHPLSILLVIALGLTSFYYYQIGHIVWKGREVVIR
jgi:chlorobactene glucosyltransferase